MDAHVQAYKQYNLELSIKSERRARSLEISSRSPLVQNSLMGAPALIVVCSGQYLKHLVKSI